ncbi:MAG: hypothetical protein K8S18_01760 [Desulfobacula sp.]|nr:hypothetical protein [Desulfobacula sp.]
MTSDTRVLKMARLFSDELNKEKSNNLDLVFPAKVWTDKSQYFGINELVKNYKTYFDYSWTDRIDRERFYRYGIALGRMFEWSQKEKATDPKYVKQIKESITGSPTDTILALVPRQNMTVDQRMEKVEVLILDPLCQVVFRDSYLSRELKKGLPHGRFHYEINVDDKLHEAILGNAEFHFGVECERFLFPERDKFLYSFINPPGEETPSDNGYQWALCLWTRKYGIEIDAVVKTLNSLLSSYIENMNHADHHTNNEIHKVNGRWALFLHIFTEPCEANDEAYTLLNECDSFMKANVESNIQAAITLLNNIEKLNADRKEKKEEKKIEESPVDMMINNKDEIRGWMTDLNH